MAVYNKICTINTCVQRLNSGETGKPRLDTSESWHTCVLLSVGSLNRFLSIDREDHHRVLCFHFCTLHVKYSFQSSIILVVQEWPSPSPILPHAHCIRMMVYTLGYPLEL